MHAKNVKLFLCAILNFDFPWMKVSTGETENEIQEEENEE